MADDKAEDKKEDGTTVVDAIDPKAFNDALAEVARLKAFHDEVLAEKKAETEKRKDAEAKAAQAAAQAKADAEGDYKELLALKDAEIKERDTKLSQWETEKKEQTVMDVAKKLANDLVKTNPAKAALLAKELRGRLQMSEDGSIKVVDEKGKLISDKLETLSDYAKKNYDFLCDGVQSTGGAGVVVQKPTGNTNTEKMDPSDRINRALGITT